MYEPRFYREQMGLVRFKGFTILFKDSDLWIGVDVESFNPEMIKFANDLLKKLRAELEEFIVKNPVFLASYEPINVDSDAPKIAQEMACAAQSAGTGPMAAVAGCFSAHIGEALIEKFNLNEVIVENGGDIFLSLQKDIVISVYAGKSALSNKIGIEIKAKDTPLGVCTSAGTVGPSVSFGNADAVVVVCKNTSLADAWATAIGNRIKTNYDIQKELKNQKLVKELLFLLIICEGKIGIQGNFKIVPLKS